MELGGSNINVTAHLEYIKLIQRSVYKRNILGDDTSQSPFDQIENFGVYTIGLTKGSKIVIFQVKLFYPLDYYPKKPYIRHTPNI